MTKFNLIAKDILQQEFRTKMRGYDPDEVDEFLDQIIKDYETYDKEIHDLQEENDRLNEKIEQLSRGQHQEPHFSTDTIENTKPTGSVTNFDILKRLSNLEKEVFGKKLNLLEEFDEEEQDETEDTTLIEKETVDSFSNHSTQDNDLEKTIQF